MLRSRETGETWIGLYNFSPIRNEDGAITGSVITARDITEQRRAEDALRRGEEHLELAQETAHVGTTIWDQRTGTLWWSEEQRRIFGIDPETEITFERYLSLVHPEDRSYVINAIDEGFSTKKTEGMNYRIIRPDGKIRFIHGEGRIFYDGDTPSYVIGTVQDVTERKRAEEALRESESRLVEAQRLAKVGDWEWDLATDNVVWSWETSVLFGRDPDLAAPTTPELPRYYTPESWARLMEGVQRAIETGEPYDLEVEVVREDGEHRWLVARGEAVRDAAGTVIRLRGTVQEITERKAAEEAMAAARWQLQSIIDNTPAMVYAFDLEERFVMANTTLAALFNTTPDEMIGKRRHAFMPAEDADWHEANDRAALEAGHALEFEEYSELGDRSITWLTTKFPLRDPQGKIFAVAGISTDITERKRFEEALQRSEARQAFLLELRDALEPLADPGEIQEMAARVLGGHLGVDRVAYFEVDDGDYVVEHDYAVSVPHLQGRYPVDAFGPRLLAAYRAGTIVIAVDVEVDPDLSPPEKAELRSDPGPGADRRAAGQGRRVRSGARRAHGDAAGMDAGGGRARRGDGRADVGGGRAREGRGGAPGLRRELAAVERGPGTVRVRLEPRPAGAAAGDRRASASSSNGAIGGSSARTRTSISTFIVEGGMRMQTLIQDLLAYSRVNTSKQDLRPTDVEDVMAAVERSLDLQLREAGAVITHDPVPVVLADPLQLEQVVANLVSNAIKFRRDDVPLRIHVGARRLNGFWEFSVSDNGIGIEPRVPRPDLRHLPAPPHEGCLSRAPGSAWRS